MRRRRWILALIWAPGPFTAAWQHMSIDGLQQATNAEKQALIACEHIPYPPQKGSPSLSHTDEAFEPIVVLPEQPASKAFEPEWVSVNQNEQSFDVGSFDCGANFQVCKNLDVVSYPAIRFYRKDGMVDWYRGPRKSSSIAKFARRMALPIFTESPDNPTEKFLSSDDVVFDATFTPDDENAKDRYRLLAKKYHDRFTFAISGAAKEHSSITCHNNMADEKQTLTELWRVEALEIFVRMCSEPLFTDWTEKTKEQLAQTTKAFLHFFASSGRAKEEYRKDVKALAKTYRDYMHFTIVDTRDFADMLPAVGVREGSKLGLSFVDPVNGDIFPFRGKRINAAEVESFLGDINADKLKPWTGQLPLHEVTAHEEL